MTAELRTQSLKTSALIKQIRQPGTVALQGD